MIGCHMNTLDGEYPPQSHLQTVSYAHNSGTPTSPISPVFGGAPCGHLNEQQQLQMLPPQLPRSKSLNDISNDSQISAFASDRFINLKQNNNNNNDINNDCNHSNQFVDTSGNYNHQIVDYNNYPHRGNNAQQIPLGFDSQTNPALCAQFPYNPYADSQQQHIMRNLNYNQCSNLSTNIKLPNSVDDAANQASVVYDSCNPMAVSLNGVTDQIGNLHL